MRKRGRPTKNGQQPAWMVERATLAIWGYEDARRKGEKHAVAVEEGVQRVRRWAPLVPISETEVRRILSQCRSVGSVEALSVSDPPAGYRTVKQPDGQEFRVLCTAYIGKRIEYPRANAASQ